MDLCRSEINNSVKTFSSQCTVLVDALCRFEADDPVKTDSIPFIINQPLYRGKVTMDDDASLRNRPLQARVLFERLEQIKQGRQSTRNETLKGGMPSCFRRQK